MVEAPVGIAAFAADHSDSRHAASHAPPKDHQDAAAARHGPGNPPPPPPPRILKAKLRLRRSSGRAGMRWAVVATGQRWPWLTGARLRLRQVLPALAYPLNVDIPSGGGPAPKGDNSSRNGMGCLTFWLCDDAALTAVGSLGPHTRQCTGLLPWPHPCHVSPMRGRAGAGEWRRPQCRGARQ